MTQIISASVEFIPFFQVNSNFNRTCSRNFPFQKGLKMIESKFSRAELPVKIREDHGHPAAGNGGLEMRV